MIFPDKELYEKVSADKLVERLEMLIALIENRGYIKEESQLSDFIVKAETYNEIFAVYNKLVDDVSRLEYDIFLNYFNNRLTDEQKCFYKQLNGVEAEQFTIELPDSKDDLNDETEILRKAFKIHHPFNVKKLFDYLYLNEYIAEGTSPKTFDKIFQLQAIHSRDRIVWIKKAKTNGRTSIKSLVELFDQVVFLRQDEQTYGLTYFFLSYFTTFNKEIDKDSLRATLSKVNKERVKKDRKIEAIRKTQFNLELILRKMKN